VVCPGAPLCYQSSNSSRTARDLDSLRRVGIQNGCDHGRISVGRSFSHKGLVPHLRRWASGERPCPQPLRAGLRCSAPPALRSESRITIHQSRTPDDVFPITSHQSRVTSYQSSIPSQPCQGADPQPAVSICRSRIDRDRARAPEARQMVAQPGRAGYRAHRNFEHRRCDTSLTLGRLWHGGTVFSYFRGFSQPQTY
jgi:hypothetical protein